MDIKTLDNDIKSGKLKNLYFFYGPELFLAENKIKSIKKRLVPKELEALAFVKLEGKEARISDFEDEWGFLPFGTDRKLILLKNTGWFNNARSAEYTGMKKMLETLPKYIYVIIEESDFDRKKEKNIEYINKIGGSVFFETMTVNQLSVWVDKLFEDSGIHLPPSDTAYIINACSQSMGRIYSEVSKLINFAADFSVDGKDGKDGKDGRNVRKIKREDIEALVAKTAEYRIYELFDDIAEQRAEKTAEKLEQILQGGEKPTAVISGISGRLYELLLVKLLSGDGLSVKEISSYLDYPRPDFAVKKMITQSKKYGEKYLKRMLKKANELDLKIKSGKISGTLAAEMYVLELVKKD